MGAAESRFSILFVSKVGQGKRISDRGCERAKIVSCHNKNVPFARKLRSVENIRNSSGPRISESRARCYADFKVFFLLCSHSDVENNPPLIRACSAKQPVNDFYSDIPYDFRTVLRSFNPPDKLCGGRFLLLKTEHAVWSFRSVYLWPEAFRLPTGTLCAPSNCSEGETT